MHDGFGGHTPGLAGQLLQPITANARLTHASSHRRALSFIAVQHSGILLAVGLTIARSAAARKRRPLQRAVGRQSVERPSH